MMSATREAEYKINRALVSEGLRPVHNFESVPQLKEALRSLRTVRRGDRGTIEEVGQLLEALLHAQAPDADRAAMASQGGTGWGTVAAETPMLSQEGIAALEESFGKGVGRKRLLVDGGTSLNKLLSEV